MMTITDSILATEAVRLATNIRQITIAPLAGRGDAPDLRRELRQLAVRLINPGGTTMKLYYSPGACSLGIHVLLEEIGKPYELAKVDLRSRRRSAA